MVKRICPSCGVKRYSAYTGTWICEVCRAVITREHDVKFEGREEEMLLTTYNTAKEEAEVDYRMPTPTKQKLVCPLRSNDVKDLFCKQDKCAWWYGGEKCCGILVIAGNGIP